MDVLWKIYLKIFVESLLSGTTPKKAIIYVKKLEHLADINEFLLEKLGHLDIVRDPDRVPWVINWTNAGNVTIQKIRERSSRPDGGIYLYITTTVMLLGLNLKDIEIVILFSPFNNLNSLVQAAGRAGRRGDDGLRCKSVLYALYNHSEIRTNLPNFDNNVREFYKSNKCLKKFISNAFSSSTFYNQYSDWCCSNCS